MTTELIHQPETKPSNKARDFQDAIIQARKNGLADPMEVAENLLDWFIDSPRAAQIAVLQFAVARMWPTTESKLYAPSFSSAPRRQHTLPSAKKVEIVSAVVADLDRQWLDLIIPMTGAQVRAAKLLPDEMANALGDKQRVGEMFTVEQLREAVR